MVKNLVEEVNRSVTDSERIAQLEEELEREQASHKAQIEELLKKYEEALEEIARLKSILNNNSGNTSLPPSADRTWKETVITDGGKAERRPEDRRGIRERR